MAMDFVSDSLIGGRRIRILTIADLWDRSSPALEWICRCLEFELCAFLKNYAFKEGYRNVSMLITVQNLAARPWMHGLLSMEYRLNSLCGLSTGT